jgi:hypothetical protein
VPTGDRRRPALLNSNYLETKMITCIRKAVAAACLVVAAGAAHAAVDPLQSALITASYSGGGMLGNDHLYADEAGSNISALDPFNTSAEFLTGDYLFAFDFAPNGTLTIYNNGAVPSGAYSASFDFGATLGAAITGFSVTDAGLTSGTPLLTIVNSHTIAIDLGAVQWNGDFNPLQAAISLQGAVAPVPEPATAWLLLAGLTLLGAARRLTSRRR